MCVWVSECVVADYDVISATITFDQRSGAQNKNNVEKIRHKQNVYPLRVFVGLIVIAKANEAYCRQRCGVLPIIVGALSAIPNS